MIVIWAVVVWGAAIAARRASSGSLWPAAVLLAIAGAADSVSAVCRSSINQMVTPDAMRGRMSSVFSLVVTSGPRLGDVESGTVAGLTSPRFSVTSGRPGLHRGRRRRGRRLPGARALRRRGGPGRAARGLALTGTRRVREDGP